MRDNLELSYRVLGSIGTNVYFVINKTTRETIIIDPAVWVFAGFMLFISILVISTAIRKIMQKRKLKKGGSA